MTFHAQRLQDFLALPFQAREFASAMTPQTWVQSYLDRPVSCLSALPSRAQTRAEVYATCRDESLSFEHRFICAMAWGSQMPRNARLTWVHLERVAKIVEHVYRGGLTREHAYELFCGKQAIAGLGPAYFTKLLFFFSPQPSFFIMDQWTAKSINYLASEDVVPLSPGSEQTNGPCPRKNSGATYARYCKMVDQLAQLHTPPLTGEQTEQKLFCSGSPNVGPWRAMIRAAYPRHTARPDRPTRRLALEAAARTPTKTSIAWAIFESNPKAPRAQLIARFMAEAQLTKAGASTYYQNFRKSERE